MILKKVEKDGIVKAIYKSSNILASKYDKANEELTITFNRGVNYVYAGVPVTDYTRFEIADSQGQVLNERIKKYPAIKGDNIDVKLILNEIENIQNAELLTMELELINFMNSVVDKHKMLTKVDMNDLKRMQTLISNYESAKGN